MEINNFIYEFEQLFDDVLDVAITEKTCFKDIDEWDSLTALMLIAMVSEIYSVKMDGNIIRNSETIKDLYNYINESIK